MTQTIAQLQRDIGYLESKIRGLENEIIRKQISIEEIVQCCKCNVELPPRVEIADNTEPAHIHEPSVREIVERLLAEGAPRDLVKLRELAVKRFPAFKSKIRNTIWNVCNTLIDGGDTITLPKKRKPRNEIHANRLAGSPALNGHTAALSNGANSDLGVGSIANR